MDPGFPRLCILPGLDWASVSLYSRAYGSPEELRELTIQFVFGVQEMRSATAG
jgi:hypothetical protein